RTSIDDGRNVSQRREGDSSIARLSALWRFRFRIRNPHGHKRAGRIGRSVHSEARRNSRWNRLRQDRRDVLSWPFRQPGIYARVSFACSEEPPAHLAPTELPLFKGRAVRPPRGGGYRPSRHRSNLRVAPMIEATTAEFAIAVMLDLIIGDPRWLPHPVEGIGFLVRRFERLLRRIMPYERAAGSVLVFMVLSVSLVFTAATLRWGRSPVAVYWIFSCLALRSLDQHARRVIEALRSGNLDGARNLVGQIVGRDTDKLSENEITRGVFETVAESLSDGIVAPLFFLALAGIPGMVAYKAINTMDSMIGYKNGSYIRFGWAAARLDDLANL